MKRFFTVVASVIFFFLFSNKGTVAQNGKIDSLFMNSDTTAVLDSLMKDFDEYLDSIARPKSFFNVSLGLGTGIFSFENKNSVFLTTEKKIIVSPSVGYFHKSGFGISASTFLINENGNQNFYQLALGPSFDAIRRNFSTGISFTRYINKDSLSFYTTPIQNEVFGYFSYKKWWVRPSASMSYGWGSKTEYERRKFQRYVQLLDQTDDYFIVIKNEQLIRDFSITLSVRKDFDWFEILSNNDNFTFTPVLLLNSGTQNFGFNTSYSYKAPAAVTVNSLPSNRNISDKTRFAPQSMALILRSSYQIGNILIQPQVLFDYYLQDANDKFNTVFSITGGISF